MMCLPLLPRVDSNKFSLLQVENGPLNRGRERLRNMIKEHSSVGNVERTTNRKIIHHNSRTIGNFLTFKKLSW